MTYDLSVATAHLVAADPRFAPLVARHGVPSLAPTKDPFASLSSTIIYQQLAGAAAKTIHGRFLGLYPRKRARAKLVAATPIETLRSAGLSRGKAMSLVDLATHFADGRVSPKQLLTATDDEVARLLLPVRGIGPWSVDMFQMFALCRPDVWPTGDLGVRIGLQHFAKLRRLPEPPRMVRAAASWRPFRSLAAWYMWRVLDDVRSGG